MELLVVGLNFRKTPVALRERFSVAAERIGALLSELRATADLQEAVVLSTCNRVEVYAGSERSSIRARHVFQSIANAMGSDAGEADLDEVESHLYLHRNEACVHHLFRVASSLDSLVVGETEIVGQVKKAYQLAQAAGATGKILNRLFQKALSVSKEVRTRSGIGRCSTSVGAVALDVAEKIFGEDFARQTVLIIGAGKMGETTLRHLSKRGAKTILISNRSIDRARELAGQFNGQIVPFEEMSQALDCADLVISSTSAPHYVLTRGELEPAMKGRGHRPVLLIDLAVPRDIDPRVQELGGVYLYNIDQLAEIANQNLQRRQAEATACEDLALEEAREFAVRLFPEARPNPGVESLHGLLPGAARFCPLARC
jgi:glutamyl-tRNA reductase